MEKIIITRRELIRQIPADLSEHDRTVSLLNALFERLPENTEKEDVDLQSGDFDEAFRLLNAFDPRTYGTVQLGESLREEQTDTAKEHVGVLGLSDTALPGNDYVGEVTGAGSADTGYYYLLATDETYADTFKNPDHTTRGLIVSGTAYTALLRENVVLTGYDYFGTYKDGGWLFNRCDEAKSTLTVDSFTLIHDLFSRNTGLFESAEMLKKFAVIIGCGSVGARAALELARAGVGRFLLIDDDILKPHNICRHTHGMRDLGRFKADLLREDILNIDPAAEVTAFRGKLENAPLSLFENLGKNGIVFATADDRSANALANVLSNTLGVPFIAVGCWARAHAGEVFYHIPNRGMKTYGETFSALLKDAPARDTHGDYFGEADARERLHFEPGTSTDIGFVTLVGVKFALDLLNLESEAYTPRVLNDYTPYTLICNTNRPEIGGENAKIFPYPLYISRSIRPAGEA